MKLDVATTILNEDEFLRVTILQTKGDPESLELPFDEAEVPVEADVA